jgi:broad specificity phosphatase PhoE
VTTIELLRHAEAHDRERWWGTPDRERPLDELGRRQSQAMIAALRDGQAIVGLHSSPFVRCRQTLEPLAAAIGLPISDEERLAEAPQLPAFLGRDAWPAAAWLGGRALALVDRLLAQGPPGRLVLCTHGDVVPALVSLLAGRDGLAPERPRLQKGGRFTLRFDGGRCVGLSAHPPPMP